MTVSYEMKASDHWAFSRYLYTHDRRQGGLISAVAVAGPAASVNAAYQPGVPWFAYAIVGVLALIAWSAILYGLIRFTA